MVNEGICNSDSEKFNVGKFGKKNQTLCTFPQGLLGDVTSGIKSIL